MRFLVDENLSPQLCPYLAGAGDTAEHVHRAVAAGASDHESVAHATRQEAVIITADTDFGTLLAQQKTSEPSIVLVRELLSPPVAEQGRLPAANLDQLREPLTRGRSWSSR